MNAPSDEGHRRSIMLQVEGYPPAKSEASSLLGENHAHADRVVRLLKEARAVLDADPDAHLGDAAIKLSVQVTLPPGIRSDATNYLGGIADVLQDKTARGSLPHLGELAEVDLFADDRQIVDVSLRLTRGDDALYTVKLVRSVSRHTGTDAARLAKAAEAARLAVAAPINDRLRSEWLSSLIWQLTVNAGGKYEQRYATRGFLELQGRRHARHEHVVTRRWLRRTLEAQPDDAMQVLELAVGCNVTVEEHKLLGRYDRTHFGWERYVEAGLSVIDTRTDEPADLEQLVSEQRQRVQELDLSAG